MENGKLTAERTAFDIKESVLWYIVLPFLLSVLISSMLILQIRLLLQNADAVANSQAVISQTNMMQKLILDMESGLRGYYITGNSEYLNHYQDAQEHFEPEMEKLKEALRASQSDPQLAEEIIRLSSGWRTYAQDHIQQRAQTRRVFSDEYSDEGKRIMDQIRARFQSILTDQKKINDQRKELVERNTKISVVVTVFLSLILSGLLSFSLFRRIKSLSAEFNRILGDLVSTRNEVIETNQHLEKTVTERTANLVAANNELEAFCYSVSHDLRAPLRGIDGFSLALAEDYQDVLSENGQQYLSYIRQGVQKMGRLIDDLLNLSRISRAELRRKEVDLTALFREISVDTRNNNREDSHINFDLVAEENMRVFADEGLMRVALENLISNAWKFSRKQEHPRIEMGSLLQNDRKLFFIRDNGVGFDMKFKDKLFHAFQRLHPESEYGGTGIGLATVKRVLVKHGGDIWVESQPDHGTTFYFYLPDEGGPHEV